jgi:hypothetical protein
MIETDSDSKGQDSASKPGPLSDDLYLVVAIAIAMLLWALAPTNPYGYYVHLRWVICGASIYLAIRAHNHIKPRWVWILGALAVLYNPLIRVHLTRDIWSVINLATIVVFAAVIYVLRKRANNGT